MKHYSAGIRFAAMICIWSMIFVTGCGANKSQNEITDSLIESNDTETSDKSADASTTPGTDFGISQEEIAKVIGVTRQTYYAMESGKREMMWGTFMSLLFFFNSIDSTAEMMRELRVFPIELVMRFNDEITCEEMEELLN